MPKISFLALYSQLSDIMDKDVCLKAVLSCLLTAFFIKDMMH